MRNRQRNPGIAICGLTCLGCYATREAGDSDRDCACVEIGYDHYTLDGTVIWGILDSAHIEHWVPTVALTLWERDLGPWPARAAA